MQAGLELFGVMMAIFVPISLLTFVCEYFKNKRNTGEALEQMKKELMGNDSTEDLEKEIAGLKERIVVLESIVTDRNYDLDRKISNL